jgi:hypothetical protein
MNLLTLVLVISFIISGIIIVVAVTSGYGQVFLHEDQAMICLSAVCTNVANDRGTAIEEAFTTYLQAKMTAMDNKIPLALEEIK